MNSEILNNTVQLFINAHLKANGADIILKGIPFKTITATAIIEQIEAKKRCEKKLPTWFNTKGIYYPNKLNIEQTSSEITAKYKAQLLSGKTLIDLTGGFGVDSYYFSKQIDDITHCEIDEHLSKITTHNYKVLNASNILCLNENGIEALKRINQPFDCIYIDPSRRDNTKRKVFLLSDCTPNVKTFQGLLLKYAKYCLIKTSPLLDIKATLNDLKFVKSIHIVAVENEVKEILWLLERNFENKPQLKTINLAKTTSQYFDFELEAETKVQANYTLPLTYLYEPNAAILKAGAFNLISTQLNLGKLHKHSHLYTSEKLVNFPGRRFKIEQQIAFNKKAFAKTHINKANVTTRNFPLSVGEIRKKLKIKDGGNQYLFFTTNLNNEKIILICTKV